MQCWSEPDLATTADHVACRRLLRGGSRTFFAASLLLPQRVRAPATALYAFCRQADDAVDLDGGRLQAIARLQERLQRAYAGQPLPLPVDRAFADVVRRHAIPQALPAALLEGLAWDAAGRCYDDLHDLHAYAVRVAGTVGAMMALLMGARTPAAVARACDLGVAMQLSNIARDVGEDARAGRLYLPQRWLRAAGIEPDAWRAQPVCDPALGKVVRRLLQAAERLYLRAEAGITALPPGCRPAIWTARLLYAEIGHEVERQGLDPLARRAVVPPGRKLRLAARALLAAAAAPAEHAAPPLPEARFLVDAVAAAPEPPARQVAIARARAWWQLREQAIWVIELFDRLERREPIDRFDVPDAADRARETSAMPRRALGPAASMTGG